EETRHAHLDTLEVLAEQGAVGLAALLASIAALVLAARAGLTRADERVAGGSASPTTEQGSRLPLVAGVVLRAVVLLGHGDFYDASTWEPLLAATAIVLAVGLGARAAFAALDDAEPRVARTLGIGAVAGALALPFDGLLDFPLEVPGLVSLSLVLVAAGCALL